MQENTSDPKVCADIGFEPGYTKMATSVEHHQEYNKAIQEKQLKKLRRPK